MKKNISDILVVSDIDNTLLQPGKSIPTYNVEMIKKFQSLGGNFTLATGRSLDSVSKYLGQIKLNFPLICYNGAVIYDFDTSKAIYRNTLPEKAKEAVKFILENFPDVGCEIMCDNFRTYIINSNYYTQQHIQQENLSYVCTLLENVTNNWIKVVLADENEKLMKIKELCRQNFGDCGLGFVLTNSMYLEIMPQGIAKGEGLKKLCSLCNIKLKNTIFIGDYYNDIEILQTAGLGVCVDNAPDDIKSLCRMVVPSCADGGVGHLLAHIINSYL